MNGTMSPRGACTEENVPPAHRDEILSHDAQHTSSVSLIPDGSFKCLALGQFLNRNAISVRQTLLLLLHLQLSGCILDRTTNKSDSFPSVSVSHRLRLDSHYSHRDLARVSSWQVLPPPALFPPTHATTHAPCTDCDALLLTFALSR